MIRDLELYGGKANVLATEFRLWLAGLVRGKNLAYTVASIAALLALGFFIAARRPSSEFSSDVRREKDSEGLG